MARPSKPIKAYQALDQPGTLDVLRTARANPDLRAGADCGEVGRVDARVASYAVAVVRSGQERELRRAFRRAMERHIQLSKNEEIPEVHLKELWSGQQRSRSRFSQLDEFDSLARFLLELAWQVRKIVPFSVVTIRPCLEAESKVRRASLLLAESLNRANICLALDRHEILATEAVVLLDDGDGVALNVLALAGAEAVDLNSSGDGGDAGLVLAGGEVAGLLGGPGAAAAGALADSVVRVEDLEQEGGQGQVKLVRGESPP